MRMRIAVLLVAMMVLPASPAAASFRADSPYIRDNSGRVRIFHGVNVVWKRRPYYPPSSVYRQGAVPASQSYFDERDAAFLAANGLNSVRLGVLWAGVEPDRDRFDEAYLDRVEDLVRMLGSFGITVLLDFHQAMYNEAFDGEGFPAWATHTEAASDREVPGVGTLPLGRATAVPPTNCCGFPGNSFTPAVMRAYDNLWLNNFGLWHEYRDAWRHVAERLGDEPNVVGYDLFNEPWPGTQWPSCANPFGCPAFDGGLMQPFYEHVISGIRAADPWGIVWWEPNATANFGVATGVGLLRPIYDPRANHGISFHAYCLAGGATPFLSRAADPECPYGEELAFRRQTEAAERNGSALFLTEFGASDDLVDIARTAALADRYLVSWHYWHYGSWADPTGNPAEQGMFSDDLDRPGSLKQAKADVLIRPYPQAVAGTPVAFSWDGTFRLTYDAASGTTEVFVPPRHFPRGYTVRVSGPAVVTSAPGASVLTLQTQSPGRVSVEVAPL